ncbi:MAG: lipid kinase [Bacteroidaceae bacterium]|nr:lipid kinase [Bacteroidaceae bacterium]
MESRSETALDTQERWGIIYSPKSGVLRTHKRWEKIRRYLKEQHIEYDFIQSEGRGSEERLGAMLAKNGYNTIIIVGGDGALNRTLQGVLSTGPEIAKSVTLGIIPNGHGNDYAKFWGIDEDDPIEAVDTIIRRRTRQVDVGILNENGHTHYFLNCLNIGLVASIMNIRHKTYRFWGLSSLSYLSSFLIMLFHRMEHKARFIVNHETIDGHFMNICVGNAHAYGLTPNAVPYNGMLDVTTVSHPAISQLVAGMYMLLTGKFLTHRNVRPYRSRQRIRIEEIGRSCVSVDGQVLNNVKCPMEVNVKQELVNFIIP